MPTLTASASKSSLRKTAAGLGHLDAEGGVHLAAPVIVADAVIGGKSHRITVRVAVPSSAASDGAPPNPYLDAGTLATEKAYVLSVVRRFGNLT